MRVVYRPAPLVARSDLAGLGFSYARGSEIFVAPQLPPHTGGVPLAMLLVTAPSENALRWALLEVDVHLTAACEPEDGGLFFIWLAERDMKAEDGLAPPQAGPAFGPFFGSALISGCCTAGGHAALAAPEAQKKLGGQGPEQAGVAWPRASPSTPAGQGRRVVVVAPAGQ